MANIHDRSLEVTVISGEDLCINDRPIKNNALITIKANSHGSPPLHSSTKPNAQGKGYLYWDEKLHVDLPADSRYILVEVRWRSSLAGDKLVGTAWIPVSDFVGGHAPENYLHFLSYRLRDTKGLCNGIINISVRVIPLSYRGTSSSPWPWAPELGIPVDREKSSGTVTGVPIWYPDQWES